MSLTIIYPENAKDLLCHYSGQIESQGIYIELDCQNGNLSVDYNAEIGYCVPFSVYHGHDQRFGIPLLTTEAFKNLLDEIKPFAEIVLSGYDSEWNGSNFIATFTDEANEALEEIKSLCEQNFSDDDLIITWNVDEYFQYGDMPDINISKKDFEEFVENEENNINENVLIDGDIEEYFQNYLNEKRKEFMETLLDDLKTVENYLEDTDKDEPFYLVLWSNKRVSELFYNDDGKLTWKRTDLISESLNYDDLGKAYCNNFYKNEYKNCENAQRDKVLNWQNGTLKADNYLAAMCEAVPEKYRYACKRLAIEELKQETQREFESENVKYFENKVIIQQKDLEISKIRNEIQLLEKKIKEIESTKPEKLETTYFSKSNSSPACRYYNLTGKYPELKK